MRRVKIAILEDHRIVLEGLIALLKKETELEITAGFTDADSFLASYKNLDLDIAIIDIVLGEQNGLDICAQVKKENPQVAVLILSNMIEQSIVLQALKNGANGYLIKNTSYEKLVEAIREIHTAKMYFSPEIAEILARVSVGTVHKPTPALTKREEEVLRLIAKGNTTQMMAAQLFVSPLTIETHRRNLMQKLEARNVAELVMVATKLRLL